MTDIRWTRLLVIILAIVVVINNITLIVLPGSDGLIDFARVLIILGMLAIIGIMIYLFGRDSE